MSPGRIAWRKFKTNTGAMIALSWIVLWVIVALLGYVITPDSTPYANTQNLELSTRKPGYQATFLKVQRNVAPRKTGFVTAMIRGQVSDYDKIPITDYRFEEDRIIAYKYTGYEGFEGMPLNYHMADVVFALDSVHTQYSQITIYPVRGDRKNFTIKEMQQKIEQNHIVAQTFWLGTDRLGRDLLSQIIIGARVSLSVGFIAISIALLLGVLLGSLAGFFRGRLDQFIVWLINVVWSIPTLLLVIAITFALGKGFWQIFIAVGLTMWVDVARVVRGQIISLRENEYIEATRALGLPNYRIITRHILPNITGPVVVISAANFASAILIEAGLSFLGIGVQPPMPSWGNMIRENYGYIILDKAFLAVIPGICIMLLVMSFMLTGNGLRNALDKSPLNY